MRKAIIPISLIAVLTVAALLPGCSLTGGGGIVIEKKEFTDFTSVDVGGPFAVEIIQSNSFNITISADGNYLDYIAVSKEGETLKIYLNPHHPFTDFTVKVRTFKAKITMPALHGLHLSGATKGTVTGFKSSDDFSLDVSGASSLNMNEIEVGNARFEISGASKVTGSIKASDVKFEVTGASKVELKGSTNNIVLNASGASNLNLVDFPLNNANVNLSGASEATTNVKEKLDVILSGASKLYFIGNPTMGNISISGASTIKHK